VNRGARALGLEARLALGPAWLLVAVGLACVAAERLPALGGAALWRVNLPENMEAFLPLAVALGMAPLARLEADSQTVEMAFALPIGQLTALRFVLYQVSAWVCVAVCCGVLCLAFGPAPFAAGLAAALGPGLFLSGLAALTASASGRTAVGLLVPIALGVADLVLRVLGAFDAFWPLQLVDLFAWRWNVAALPWPWVKLEMAVVGVALIAVTAARARRDLTRHL
jgi:hypothetical protein